MFVSPEEFSLKVSSRARQLRLQKGLTQSGLARRSGVPLGTLKRFEHTGQIAFVSLVRIAMALGQERAFDTLFAAQEFKSMDDVLKTGKPVKRGRIT